MKAATLTKSMVEAKATTHSETSSRAITGTGVATKVKIREVIEIFNPLYILFSY